MNKNRISIIILLVGIFILSHLFGSLPLASVVRSNDDNLTIRFSLPQYEISSINNYTYIECPNLKREEIEGKIDLPYCSFFVGVPSQGDAQTAVVSVEDHYTDISAQVAPFPRFEKDPMGDTYVKNYIFQKEKYLFESTNKFLEVSEPFLWRQQTVVQVILRPFTVEDDRLRIIDEITLSFSLSGNKRSASFTDKNFKTVFENTIINFDVAKKWSLARDKREQFDPFSQADRWFRIQISETGICKLTKQDLSDAGIDVDNLDPDEIKVFNGGGYSQDRSVHATLYPFEEIPVFVDKSGSDFNIYFYIRGTDGYELNEDYDQYYNPYTGENTYWLTYNTDLNLLENSSPDARKTLKRETISTYTYSEHFEEDHIRENTLLIEWYWTSFSSSGSSTKYFDFEVSNLNTNEQQQLIIRFSYKSYSLDIETYVNDILLTDYVWSSNINYATVTYTGNFLSNGTNELKIVQTTPGSQTLYLDSFEIEYTKNLKMEDDYLAMSLSEENVDYTVNVSGVSSNELNIFKVTDFSEAEQVTDYQLSGSSLSFNAISDISGTQYIIVNNGGYIIPENIEEKYKPTVYLNGAEQTSYLRDEETLANTEAIIITPEEFWEQSKDLADVHVQYDDLNVLVVNIDDVYDEFSWGLIDVVAIRYFLNYVYDYYALIPDKQLSYVVLAGDGTNDLRGYEEGSKERNKILPFLDGEDVSDDYFSYFSSKLSPSLMTGRLPAYTDTQMDIIVQKILDYITQPNYGNWRNRVILSADDFLKSGKRTETSHTAYAESCAVKIESNVELIKEYGIMYPLDEFQSKPEARENIIKMINNGAAIFYYIGHGGYDVLGDEEYFRASRDISKLDNSDYLNFFLAASCNVGFFDSNTTESVAERMLYTKDKGAVVAFASARSGGYGPCSSIVVQVVNNANDGITIGQAVLGSKDSSAPYYILFGDPMMKSALPAIRGDITIPEEYADSLKARQTASMDGIIDTTGYQFDEVFNIVFDTDYSGEYPYDYYDTQAQEWEIEYYPIVEKGEAIFKGPVSVENNSFDLGFIVPDDVLGGQEGHVFGYCVGSSSNGDVDLSLRYNKRSSLNDYELIINGYAEAENDGPPQITMWLDDDSFKSGDYVSSSPVVYVEITDSNGVNITNYPGHRILLTIDNEDEYNITEDFVYNIDSYMSGTIEYQLESIPAGIHTIRLEVFDNLNEVAYKEVEFKIKNPDDIDVRTVLNYPNPMDDHTYFTFYLDGDATVDIEIFTVAGRKIKTINDQILQTGYNQVLWDGKDEDGDRPSNGVYFYKLIVNGKRIDEIFKIIIFH